jgi:SAM-dependent methyltransferase
MDEIRAYEADDTHRLYFEGQLGSNIEFWRRFGHQPEAAGKHVLDLGCGHGALSIELAHRGATVFGLDLNPELITWATRNLSDRYSDLVTRVDFAAQDVTAIPGEAIFDLVVCKDTLEHVADVGGTLRALHRLLKPGGELWAGFSPLYYSPRGDHGRAGIGLPWSHALLPRRLVTAVASRHSGQRVGCLEDLGLNGMTPRAFRRHIYASHLQVESIAYNRGDSTLLRAFSVLRRLPALEALMTVSVYTILRKEPV